MHGQNKRATPQVMVISPEEAAHLLDCNTQNRPLNQTHVNRIARQIIDGKWKFNGDTIKISSNNDILDGQHRLWAIMEAKIPVETIVVKGIEADAFSTIDTLRKPRSGADILSLIGVTNHRSTISGALQWLIRWQRGCVVEYRAPHNRLENSDIEEAFKQNPGIAHAAERCNKLRNVASPSLMAFFYYILSNRNPDLAERLLHTLEFPAGVGMDDPFFKLRVHFLAAGKRRDPISTIALMVKSANAAEEGRSVKVLKWQNYGALSEDFPKLKVTAVKRTAV